MNEEYVAMYCPVCLSVGHIPPAYVKADTCDFCRMGGKVVKTQIYYVSKSTSTDLSLEGEENG